MGRKTRAGITRALGAAAAIFVATSAAVVPSPAGAVGGSIDGTVTNGAGTLPAGTVEVLACSGTSWFAGCGGPTSPVLGDGSYTIPVADGEWTVGVRTLQGLALGTPATVNVAGAPATQHLAVQAAVVAGRVQHPSDGSAYPVGNASLVLCPTGTVGGATALGCSFFAGGVDAPTDANGDRTIVVPPGQWYAGGIASASMLGVNAFAQGLGAPAVDLGVLTDGQVVTPVFDIGGAFVDGTVRDATTSAPLVGRGVSTCPAAGSCFPAPASSVQTGGAGQYRQLLPPGDFVITAGGQGGALAQAPVTVADAQDQVGVDLAIGGGSISGSFEQADGSPYLTVSLPLSLCDGGGSCVLVPVNNPSPGSSTFTIANVTPGDYDIIAGSPNTSAMAHLVGAPVTVVEGQDSAGEIVRLGGGSIAATVTNNGVPVPSASVRACLQIPLAPNGEACSGSPFGGTDAAGQVTLGGLPPGTYIVRATTGGLSGSATPVGVTDGNTSTASVSIAQSGISGTVTGDTGAGAMVVACPGTTDPVVPWAGFPSSPCAGALYANVANGAYSYPSLSPGNYRLRAYALVNNAIVNGDAVAATVTSGVTVVNLALPGGNSGSVPTGGGTVTLASPAGTSLTGIVASAVPADPAPPAGAQFPVGVLSFSVTLPVGQSTADVVLQLPPGTNPNAYFKLRNGAWADFTANTTIAGDTVTLHLVDNDSFDTDPTVGVIGDPGAPVVADTTGPAVECPANPAFLLRERGASLTANASDAGSGVAAPTVTVDVDTATVGAQAVDVTATDLAGNSTTVGCPYAVQYRFVGFGPLVGNNVLNTMKAGRSAPMTWWLGDAAYKPVSTAASFVDATVTTVPCPAMPSAPVLLTTSGSGFKSLGLGAYLHEWKSSTSDAGQCKVVTVSLADGTTHSLTFKLK